MNHCGIQQFGNNGDHVVCPKPVRTLRWQMCYQQDGYDSKSGTDLLDIILAKSGGYGAPEQTCTSIASSPPFFCGSPPSRVSNPLIQDARFGVDKIFSDSQESMISNPASGVSSSSPSSSSSRKVGCVRPNYGNKPAVRIVGFDRIPALA
ncbi:hypothetical protein QVD17_29205 [Tagetes erecta]|uniref:Uncharacterized protein n=1 Tax=Tagetes erecta TaxID=13708 RepID=A0AAD8KBL9_TARER|nr:hypothetical protein QVD17_29205 [Tagetes erecta]